ncbi:hypothetical protein [Oceanomicrobium pacificus]|uniref:Phospholipase A2 n=1 Tax=Oceanomicrobium pacificus TaxID=2692916 RepID=A0A6B0TYK9_9RHOB|nr:hypothetical protein [Oceanomicrobium pacificus]MXU66508.1 hypothetical protein [Oceanomicrobium pacificus]
MSRVISIGVALGLPVLPAALPAQDRSAEEEGRMGGLHRRFERPAHEDLAEVRSRTGATLAPFTTDGCSGGMSASWELLAREFPSLAEDIGQKPPWAECCVIHDRAYHEGGSDPDPDASYDARLQADRQLEACVTGWDDAEAARLRARHGLDRDDWTRLMALTAGSMYLAVRAGGGPCTGLPWRWGYGWPDCGWFADDPSPSD